MSSKTNKEYVLNEGSFLPIKDDRFITSGIDDVDNGDNFRDYAKYFYGQYEEEIFDVDLNLADIERQLFVADRFSFYNN